MAWTRRGYYRRSRRVNGRVVTEYLGAGSYADLAAKIDTLDRDRRDMERAAARIEREEWEAREAILDELDDLCDLLVRATLLVNGYRQHARGEWRKRRVKHHPEFPNKAEPARQLNAPAAPAKLDSSNAALPAAPPVRAMPTNQPPDAGPPTKDNGQPNQPPDAGPPKVNGQPTASPSVRPQMETLFTIQPQRGLFIPGRGWTDRLFAPTAPAAADSRPVPVPATNTGPKPLDPPVARSALIPNVGALPSDRGSGWP